MHGANLRQDRKGGKCEFPTFTAIKFEFGPIVLETQVGQMPSYVTSILLTNQYKIKQKAIIRLTFTFLNLERVHIKLQIDSGKLPEHNFP